MKNVNIITRRARRDLATEVERNGFAEIRGKLEVTASRNGKPFHYDVGENMVTIFAKHATMHILTGEMFSAHGKGRTMDFSDGSAHTATGVGTGRNLDGTLISGQQYFTANTTTGGDPIYDLDTRWSRSTVDADSSTDDTGINNNIMHPFFPTKMLFGTGFEWALWNDIPAEYQSTYTNQNWNTSLFEQQIASNTFNDYSNEYDSITGDLVPKRTMNDIFAGSLASPSITDEDFGIPGAVKNGSYRISSEERYDAETPVEIKTELLEGNEFLQKVYQGIGSPAFIYARRENRFFQPASEVQLSSDEDDALENKITFTSVMPEQTGATANGIFYPYNGFTLKVAGLFCDAGLVLENTKPTTSADAEFDYWNKMSYGIMYAKRYISPIEKSHDVSISSRWTLYL